MCTYGNTTWDLVVWVLGAFLESLVVFKLANGTPLIVFSKAILTLLESKKKKKGGGRPLEERCRRAGNKWQWCQPVVWDGEK